jgi:hypothetical protein
MISGIPIFRSRIPKANISREFENPGYIIPPWRESISYSLKWRRIIAEIDASISVTISNVQSFSE